MPQLLFGDLAKQVRAKGQHFVDSRTWESDWSEAWAAFSDVLGFGARCLQSEPATVNTIVRFHRSVTSAAATCAGSNLRLFRFTDAVYAISPELETVLRFSSTLQHYCLAHNRVIMEDKNHALAHNLLMVRTTLGHGRTLVLPEPSAPEVRTLGVETKTLLAGASIVKAYGLEKRTVAGLISLSTEDHRSLESATPIVRGQVNRPRKLLQEWFRRSEAFTHDGVIDFPWLLLRPLQAESQLWADSRDEVLAKLKTLVEACDLLSGEFLMAQVPLEVSKHRAGLIRHINEMTQRLENKSSLRRWDELDLRAALGF